jgi:hypothetical protein
MTAPALWLSLPPDWSAGVTVEIVWRTGMMALLQGGEQRSRLYGSPRLKTSFTLAHLEEREFRWWRREIFSHQHEIIGVPLWPHTTPLTQDIEAGEKILPVSSTQHRLFTVGGYALLVHCRDWTVSESGVIAMIAENAITLEDGLTRSWPAGSLAAPAFAARISAELEETLFTASGSGLEIEAAEWIT